MSEDKNTDSVFREKLGKLEKEPPAFIWDNIQNGLAAQKRKKRILYLRIAGVAAALVIAFFAGMQLNHDTTTNSELVVENNFQDVKTNSAPNHLESIINENEKVLSDNSLQEKETKKLIVNNHVKSIRQEISKRKASDNQQLLATTDEISTERTSENINLIESFKSLLNSKTPNTSLLATKKQKGKKQVFTPEEIKIIDNNRSVLAMNKTDEKKGNWMVGAAISPSYSLNSPSYSEEYASNMANPRSGSNVNVGGGFSVEYKTKSRWSIESGLFYSKLNQNASNSMGIANRMKGDYYYSVADEYYAMNAEISNGMLNMNSVAGVIEVDNQKLPNSVQLGGSFDEALAGNTSLQTNGDFNQNFEYLEIPLLLKYMLVDSDFNIQLLSGISTNMLVGNNVILKDNSGSNKIGKTLGMADFTYSGILGIEVNYQLASNISLNVEPRIKYYFNSLNENVNVNFQPYVFGLFTGLTYSF